MRGARPLAAAEGHGEPGEGPGGGKGEAIPGRRRRKNGGNNSSCQKMGGCLAVGPAAVARPGSAWG